MMAYQAELREKKQPLLSAILIRLTTTPPPPLPSLLPTSFFLFHHSGSQNQWDFEEDAYKSTTCTIHTFDCTIETGNMPAHIRDRVTFHKICMGSSENNSKGKVFMNLKEIMDMLGHSHVTLLKVKRRGGNEDQKQWGN